MSPHADTGEPAMTPDPRFRDSLPYPVAVPYALAFDPALSATDRRWAVCFTPYQALRLVALALAGQDLRQPIDPTAEKAVKSVNECVAALRSPMFSDWVTAVRTLPDRWPALGLAEPFPTLRTALDRLKGAKAERSVGLSGRHRLDPLEAIRALRNATAHGGVPDPAAAEHHLAEYVPVLHEVLDAFAWRRSAAIRKALHAASSGNVDLKARYAGSLCLIG